MKSQSLIFSQDPSTKLTIYINGRFLSQRITGIQRYARESLLALDNLIVNEVNLEFNLVLLVPNKTVIPEFKVIKVEYCGRFQGHLWEQYDLPSRVGRERLFSFCPTGPLIKKQQIITIHDLAVFRIPDAFSLSFRWWYKFSYLIISRRSKLVATVSQFSADELNYCLKVPKQKIRITSEGWQHLQLIQEDEAVLKKFNLPRKGFVLAVSSPTPNKNFSAIVKAFDVLGANAPRCVAAGKADEKVFKDAKSGIDKIEMLGYVSDAELKSLYKNAACFIFPSFYEGFGIPPLEAMACGCPILAADIPSVKEVCGENAIYFDPRQPKQLAVRMSEIMNNPEMQETLALSGIARAHEFSWMKSARINLTLLKEFIRLNAN